MGEVTKIEWTDHTFNAWRGCVHARLPDESLHPGCEHCYAEAGAKRFPDVLGEWGSNGTRIVAPEKMWDEPRRWNDRAAANGVRERVFCQSISDVFEDWSGPLLNRGGEWLHQCDSCIDPNGDYYWDFVPWYDRRFKYFEHGCGEHLKLATLHDVRRRLFRLIDSTPWLDWLLLTKRPENIRQLMPPYFPGGYTPEAGSMNQEGARPNVRLGTSISDQPTADVMVPELLKCHDLSPVRFLSIEPLVGPVDFRQRCFADNCDGECGWPSRFDLLGDNKNRSGSFIDWVIVGGESGPKARPCRVEWIRSIVQQCRDADVPCFVKQLGALPVGGVNMTPQEWRLRDKKGGDPSEWPKDLRVREFPKGVGE